MQTDSFSPAQRQRVKKLFDEAYEMSTATRWRWLAVACADDAAVQAEVEKLLQAAAADSLLEHQPVVERLALPVTPAPQPGQTISPYRLLRELGRGGMGTVWLAERADKLHQEPVALKLVQSTFDREAVARFQRERELLARLNHPNIARLLDGGSTEAGGLYLVMEYVEGQPLTRYCREHQVSLAERLNLFRTVCAAVQFAHQNFIVHRDLKPDNIFVTADGTPKLLDFGIAKLLERDGQSGAPSTLTRDSRQPFTPLYASPEQIRNETITTASDVYSLGVLLYELLTGAKPYHAKAEADILRAVCEDEPLKPSSVKTESQPDGVKSGSLSSSLPFPPTQLRGDLDNIVMKALRKEPTQRYASVEQFSEDLRRYLEGEPVAARPATLRYRAGKYVRRNRPLVAGLAFFILALVAGTLVTFWQLRASQARERLQRRQLYAADMRQAGQDWAELNLSRARETINRYRSSSETDVEADLRGFEWFYLWNALYPPQQVFQHSGVAAEFALTADQARIYIGIHSGAIEQWNTKTQQFERVFARLPARLRSIDLARDAGRLAACGEQGALAVWDIASGQVLFQNSSPTNIRYYDVALSHDGKLLLAGANDGLVYAWDVNSAKQLTTLRYSAKWVQGIEFSPDGKFFAVSGTGESAVKIWETVTFRPLEAFVGSQQSSYDVVFSADGTYLAAANRNHQVLVWSVAERKLLQTFQCDPTDRVWDIAFSPDGKTLATVGGGRVIRLWDWVAGRNFQSVPVEAEISTISFLPQATEPILYATTGTQTLRLDFQQLKLPMKVIPHTSDVTCIAVSPNGQQIVYGDAAGKLTLINSSTSQQLSLSVAAMPIESVAFSPDGQTLAVAYGYSSQQGVVELRDPFTGAARLAPAAFNTYVYYVTFAPDGKTLATANGDGSITVLKLEDLQPLFTLRSTPNSAHYVFYSPDSQRLISLHENYLACGWDARSGSKQFEFSAYSLSGYSPDGRYFASTDEKHNIVLRDGATGEALRRFSGHSEFLISLVFTPDGRRLASAGDDLSVRLWEVKTGAELLAMKGHTARVRALAFSPDGQTLYSGSKDKTFRHWRTATEAEVQARQ